MVTFLLQEREEFLKIGYKSMQTHLLTLKERTSYTIMN